MLSAAGLVAFGGPGAAEARVHDALSPTVFHRILRQRCTASKEGCCQGQQQTVAAHYAGYIAASESAGAPSRIPNRNDLMIRPLEVDFVVSLTRTGEDIWVATISSEFVLLRGTVQYGMSYRGK